MPHAEYQYLNTLRDIIDNGERVPNRTGVDTLRVLGVQHRYNFDDGFPLLTTKRVWMKGVIVELLWMLSGSQNIKFMVDNGVNIWTDDAYRHYKQVLTEQGFDEPLSKGDFAEAIKNPSLGIKDPRPAYYELGDLGPVYGSQWRAWPSGIDGFMIDQMNVLTNNLIKKPASRRHILSAWNVADVDNMGLPPCHVMSQYTITNDNKLWCHMYQRSCDMFLGVPFNIASYSLLTHMIAKACGLEPGGFIHTMHDTHIYVNHLEAVQEQLERTPREFPTLRLSDGVEDMDSWQLPDITVEGYNPWPKIKAQLNVG